MSDYPTRIEKFDAALRESMPAADFAFEEIWKVLRSPEDVLGKSDVTMRRYWLVEYAAGWGIGEVQISDHLIRDSIPTAVAYIRRSIVHVVGGKSDTPFRDSHLGA